jgi:membrane fusion protein, multidrug efflux system
MYRSKETDETCNRVAAPPLGAGPTATLAPNTPAARAEPAPPAVPNAEPPRAPLAPIAADAPAAEADDMATIGQKGRRRRGRLFALGAFAALAAAAAGWFGYDWWTVGRFTVTTDDAYVQAYTSTIAAKVSGYVASVLVTDDSYVHTGDVIATIDDGDYRLAVDSAREKIATQEATIRRMSHQIAAQEAAVAQAKSQLVAAEAVATRNELELRRQNLLVARDASSRQLLEQAQANRDQAVAAVNGAQAAIEAAAANLEVMRGQQQEAITTLAELKTALAKAERDLSFTIIRAPIDGVIGNRALQVGDYVQPGQRLASLVPLAEIYVNANFKETQIARLRPGQPALITVDALPEHTIEGTVESFSPASGAVFSLLPPDNATGNFTKIVQRLPVRIRVPAAIASEGILRPGMSVVVSVNTKPTALAKARPPLPAQAEASRVR